MTTRSKRVGIAAIMIAGFIGLFPVSYLLADPIFTRPYDPGIQQGVPLVWSDHIEIRLVKNISEISPRPKNANYTFTVAPERLEWVEDQIRRLAQPRSGWSWSMRVRNVQLGRQEIELEMTGDGVRGLVYEASANEIVPLRTKLSGPGGALIIMGIDLCVWGVSWATVWFARFMVRRA